MRTTLVTGGLGYVGRYVAAQLRERGAEVVSYNRDFHPDVVPGVHFVQGELFDVPRLVRTIEEFGVERIVHTAAMSHPELSVELPITTFAANVDGTVHLLEAARLTSARRVLNFSSECAYGVRPEALVTEDLRLEPTTPYGVTKAAMEMLAHVYNARYGFDITSLRVSEVYGPGNRMPQYLCELVDAALAREPYRLEAGADQRFQFVHVQDVARAAVLAVSADRLPQEAYNITGGTRTTLREAADAVAQRVPGAEFQLGPGFLDLDRQGAWDISAAERDFGYRPEWSMDRGIQDYVAWREGAAAVA
jgi:nucleoside-diphosphate-sugar epimerase